MAKLDLEVPVLVARRGRLYRVLAVFQPGLRREGRRLSDVLDAVSRALRESLSDFSPGRDDLAEWLRKVQAPEVHLRFPEVSTTIGSERFDGRVATVEFDGAPDVRVLPELPQPWCWIGGEYTLTEAVRARLRLARDAAARDGLPFDPRAFAATGNEYVLTLRVPAVVQTPGIPYSRPRFAPKAGKPRPDGERELSKVAQDWRDEAPDPPPVVGRDALVDRVESLVFGQPHRPVALVGPTGAGRTAVLRAAWHRYASGLRVREEKPAGFWHVDPNRVIAGMSVVGDWERRWMAILDRVSRSENGRLAGRIYVDNPIALFRVGTSTGSRLTLADVARPYLEKRSLVLVLESTPDEWIRLQQFDQRFADLLTVIRVDEPPLADALPMLVAVRPAIEERRQRWIEDGALEAVARERTRASWARPGAWTRRLEQAARSGGGNITAAQLAEEQDRAPPGEASAHRDPAGLDDYLARRLVGQPGAVRVLADTLTVLDAGLCDPNRPRAVLLFAGPTGVGKTEAAKLLARAAFAGNDRLVRFDMNEYVAYGDAGRLVGDWRQPDGQLTARVRHQPECVLLLDEIEKAHPEIHDVLLQVMGEGRLTDALGRTTDFTRTLIVMTSNLGAAQAARTTGFAQAADTGSAYRQALTGFFRPEWLNRVDRMVFFQPLDASSVRSIARLQMERLRERDGLQRRMSFLDASDEALDDIAAIGFDPVLGARALKRAVERELAGRVADALLELPPAVPALLQVRRGTAAPEVRTVRLEPLVPTPPAARPTGVARAEVEEALTAILALRDAIFAERDAPGLVAASSRANGLLQLQEQVGPVKDALQDLAFDLQRRKPPAGAPPGRIALARTAGYEDRQRWQRLAALYAQRDLHAQLQTLFQGTPRARNGRETEREDLLLRARWLVSLADLVPKEHDVVHVRISSLVRDPWSLLVTRAFVGNFTRLMGDLGFGAEAIEGEVVRVSGFGVARLLDGEFGVHLLQHDADQIPVHVRALAPGNVEETPDRLRIVRAIDRSQDTAVDLASGLVVYCSDGTYDPADWLRLAEARGAFVA